MRTANTHKNMARCAATATLACVLGLGLAAPAYADTASDLAAARTKLEQIGTQTQQIYDELATQTQALDQTAGEITQKQQEIADGQAKLSTYVAGEYKTGGLSLLQVLTGVDDLSDMLNRLFYYGKVSDKQAQTIQEVKELKQQLTDKQAEQEKNVAATQKKVDELNAQQAEAQNVVNSLDSQLQAELAAEAEANAALQAGINASTAEKATVSNDTAGTTENTNNGGGTTNNGGGNTLPINLSYLDTAKPLQQFSVTLGQCVDKDQTTSPNLLVRTSSYGDSVTAGQAFDLSLGLYATDGNENLDDVIVSLTLPENISLNGGSLSSYLGTICPKQTRDVTFQVMPASGFTGTVASITVNMTGTGSVTGKEVSGTTTISVPVSQPDRFEVGQLELSGDTIYVGDTGSVSLSYVNKGKNPVSNLEARLTGTNLGAGGYQYLGNLAAGTEGSVDFDIVPDAAGTVSGIITLNYEDASGNPQTISKDFSVSAEEMNMDDFNYDPSMDDTQPEQTGMPVWAWVLIGVCGAVVVIVVIVVVVRKRKKAKALAALEAEDSDEDL